MSKVKILTKTAACAIALVSLAVAAPACKKDESGDAAGGGAGGKSASKAASNALSYMPKDAGMVFGINVSSLANAKIAEKYRDEVMKGAPKELNEMQQTCGINIMKDLKSVVVGMVGEKRGTIVMTGDFTKAKLEDCIKKVAEKEGKKMTMSDEGNIRVYNAEGDDDAMYAHYPKDGTVVICPTDLGGKELLASVLAGGKLADGPVMKLVNSTKTSASIWAAGNPSMFAGKIPGGEDITGFAATLNAGDNLDIKALVNYSSEEKATSTVTQAKGLIEMGKGNPMAKQFIDIINKFKIEADGKAVKAGVSLSQADIEKVTGFAKSMGAL